MNETTHEPTTAALPLAVDLDGTLIHTDMLAESFFALAAASPWKAIKALWSLRRGRAPFKAAIAQHTSLDISLLPYNMVLLTWLKAQQASGRPIYLASASDARYVQAVAEHLGIFTGTFASHGIINLKSSAKAAALCATFGEKQFDYVGNEKADIAVWQHASGVLLTNASKRFEATVKQLFPHAIVIPAYTTRRRDYIKALRPHQWLKNLLIFVPALAAHHFDLASIRDCTLAFFSFSLCASSGYILNDLLDVQHDRQHHSKCNRPFASGKISLRHGAVLLVAAFAAAIAIGLMLPAQFIAILFTYYFMTLIYSTIVKRHMMLDVVMLSLLYGIRLVAGGVALAVPLSAWLLSFAAFFFLSLALIKRCSELVARQNLGVGDPSGRGYRLTDLPMLESMAAASGYVAALTSGLYISGANVTDLYKNPGALWAIPIILLYWISRILLLTHRGDMHDDPVIFAARDRTSLICGALIVLVLFASI